MNLIDGTIRLERIRFIKQWLDTNGNDHIIAHKPVSSINWLAETHSDNFVSIGIHPLEEWQRAKFRWIEAVCIVQLQLQPGSYVFTMEWMPIRRIKNLTAYINEIPLSISKDEYKATAKFTVNTDQQIRFSLTCEPLGKTRNDPRFLGLPIKSMTWIRE